MKFEFRFSRLRKLLKNIPIYFILKDKKGTGTTRGDVCKSHVIPPIGSEIKK